ncbi:FAD-binding oxidoreductase [Aureimonas jatrophae]|uniref:FAD/FMN-containing dehydrogenase n=1 Tax=Aureimonas jatrophae TaxID=1166073 RepID=A0A1H0GC80_9HYPH|nr:FAD-binding oxidoreductase [Aureimonas jatrophae]MBB3949506.1 FAD/FMN-containing dehydrogenase [Aureimonas jatrophae]SDO04492.1 FAD/FMN-containing dehydrogenase [Aureimonas jatrophae]
MSETYDSWGRLGRPQGGRRAIPGADGFPSVRSPAGLLPRGNGRSYGDSCLNDAGLLVDLTARNRIFGFDAETGLLDAEPGVLLRDVTRTVAPLGWFLPVTPGTQFVTLGGALANDVHGKNHHRRGTFGTWVEDFTLVRSDRLPMRCARDENSELFAATIGGMGLTGIVTRLRVRMMRVASSSIRQVTHRFDRLEDYFDRAEEADERHEYAVAWIDSLATGSHFGRGHLICGDHEADGTLSGDAKPGRLRVPFTPPVSPLRGVALRAFNELYYRRAAAGRSERTVAFEPFFYPLDGVTDWNRLYGPRGLLQHQSVVPYERGATAVRALMECAHAHGQGSFLTVLKRFGDRPSPALLSFPRRGWTLTLDFPHRGSRTLDLMAALDRIAIEAGGAVNPYKDATMSPDTFAASFPEWRRLEAWRDPAIVSDSWRRTALRLPAQAGRAEAA